MKRLQLQRWSGSVLSPRIRPSWRTACLDKPWSILSVRHQSSAAAHAVSESDYDQELPPEHYPQSPRPSPPPSSALKSPRLAALHARLALPEKLPLQTLARTLVDASADPSPQFNNRAFSVLGYDLLSYYTAEYLICSYPRLPMRVLWSAMYSYVGDKTLAVMAQEWGIEVAAEPGSEVDPGLLQFKRLPPGTEVPSPNPETDEQGRRRGLSSRIVNDDAFGELPEENQPKLDGVTLTRASATFVRALMGALYLHGGRPAAKNFFKEHFMSRELSVADLFSFSQPARDLSKLCAREGFERPVAKILSETGRLSRHPVFNVGIFSGKDKLGEGSGSSLTEARFRAAVAALKAWYVYSPLTVRVPSSMEEKGAKPWEPVLVDPGEIIV
ncbi:hypothetical protein VTO42DRAFT_8446 [Malbranchea cinnamomea]